MVDPNRVRAKLAVLANHVIASSGWATATEFRESFTRLEQHGLIPPDLAGRLRDGRDPQPPGAPLRRRR